MAFAVSSVDLDGMDWVLVAFGARQKAYIQAGTQLRLLELTPEFVEPGWCERGHVGYVLEGQLEVDFHGEIAAYAMGSGLLIPGGAATGHKARSLARVTLLVLFETVA